MWIYEEKEIKSHDDLDPLCTDIVYCISYACGSLYIGKKTVRSTSTLPALKTKPREGSTSICRHILRDETGKIITSKAERKKARDRGLKAKAEYYEQLTTDKPFVKYEGSSKNTKGLNILRKDIIYQCTNKKTATYLEAMLLFEEHALFDAKYANDNILGSFYDDSMDGLIE